MFIMCCLVWKNFLFKNDIKVEDVESYGGL